MVIWQKKKDFQFELETKKSGLANAKPLACSGFNEIIF